MGSTHPDPGLWPEGTHGTPTWPGVGVQWARQAGARPWAGRGWADPLSVGPGPRPTGSPASPPPRTPGSSNSRCRVHGRSGTARGASPCEDLGEGCGRNRTHEQANVGSVLPRPPSLRRLGLQGGAESR